jgi:hypothetical protein
MRTNNTKVNPDSKISYMKNDCENLATYLDYVPHWRNDYLSHSKHLNESTKQIRSLNQNLTIADQCLLLFTKLKKTGEQILADIKILSVTREENNLDKAFFQLSKVLQSIEHKISYSDALTTYDFTLQAVNCQLYKAEELKKTVNLYNTILVELKKYCPEKELEGYKNFIVQLEKSIHEQIHFLKNLLIELSRQHNLVIQKKVTQSQLESYIKYSETECLAYQIQSKKFNSLVIQSTDIQKNINEKNLDQSFQVFSDIKKSSGLFNTAFQSYLNSNEQVNLDQKFYQFGHHIKILEKKLIDLKDENIDDDYQAIFNTLLEAVNVQLKEAMAFKKVCNNYSEKLDNYKHLSFEVMENYRWLQQFQSHLDRQIELFSTCVGELILGKNQRAITSTQELQQKISDWKNGIILQLLKTDNLSEKLIQRETHFKKMEQELFEQKNISLEKFPLKNENYNHIKSLLKGNKNYKKYLMNLQKKILEYEEQLNSLIKKSQSEMSFINKSKDFQNIAVELIKEYDNILTKAVEFSEEIDCFNKTISRNIKHHGTDEFIKESDLATDLQTKIQSDIKYFSTCHQLLTVETSPTYKNEQLRITRVNCLLQNIYNDLAFIEEEIIKMGNDASGIVAFKQQFAAILLYNTAHQEDLESTIKQYLKWLHQIEQNIYLRSHPFPQTIKNCRKQFKQLESELLNWRISTLSYVSATSMRILSPVLSGMLSIVLPGVDLLTSVLPADTVMIGSFEKITKTGTQLVTEHGYTTVGDRLSPTDRSINFMDENENSNQNKEKKFSLAGVRRVVSHSADDSKVNLSLDTSHLWRDSLYASLLKTVYDETMVLTVFYGSLAATLGVTGVGTPAAFGMLTGAVALGGLFLATYKECQERGKDAEIRFAAKERIQTIDKAIQDSLQKKIEMVEAQPKTRSPANDRLFKESLKPALLIMKQETVSLLPDEKRIVRRASYT